MLAGTEDNEYIRKAGPTEKVFYFRFSPVNIYQHSKLKDNLYLSSVTREEWHIAANRDVHFVLVE